MKNSHFSDGTYIAVSVCESLWLNAFKIPLTLTKSLEKTHLAIFLCKVCECGTDRTLYLWGFITSLFKTISINIKTGSFLYVSQLPLFVCKLSTRNAWTGGVCTSACACVYMFAHLCRRTWELRHGGWARGTCLQSLFCIVPLVWCLSTLTPSIIFA